MSVSTIRQLLTTAEPAPVEAPQPVARPQQLRAVVLLAGSVRPNRFRSAIGRSFLELPVRHDLTVLDHWQQALAELARYVGVARLPVRVLVDRAARLPARQPGSDALDLRIEPDRIEFRGTGGLLRDVACDYEDDDLLLIVHAAQLSFEPLPLLFDAMLRQPADFSILVSMDGAPQGLKLARCASLRAIPPVGFVDLKEQGLPRIARHCTVRVVRTQRDCCLPIRTGGQYIAALREHHRRLAGERAPVGPFDEDWRHRFALAEPGAVVHPSALVHDSVILEGAKVAAGAVVARSVICPGAVVRQRQSIIDHLVIATRRRSADAEVEM